MRSTTIRPKKIFSLQKLRNFRENLRFSDSIFFSQISPRISRPIFLDMIFDGKSSLATPEINSFVANFFRRPKFTEIFARPQGYSLSPPFPPPMYEETCASEVQDIRKTGGSNERRNFHHNGIFFSPLSS